MFCRPADEMDSSPCISICIAENEKLTTLFQLNLPAETVISLCRQIVFTPAVDKIAAKTPCDAFYLWENYKLVRVETENILYIKADRCYCEIYLTNDRRFLVSIPMSEVERHLPADRFIRIHRSFVVNLKMIMEIEGNRIFLPTGKELPLGRQYRSTLMQSLNIINTQNKKYSP